jgi:hypothetical protein
MGHLPSKLLCMMHPLNVFSSLKLPIQTHP